MSMDGIDVRTAIVSRLFALKNRTPDSPVQFFIDYSGHVDQFNVRIYLKGWEGATDPDIFFTTEERRNTAYSSKDTIQPEFGRDMYDIIKDVFAGMTKEEIRNKYHQMLYH